jgi:hypothetical protein
VLDDAGAELEWFGCRLERAERRAVTWRVAADGRKRRLCVADVFADRRHEVLGGDFREGEGTFERKQRVLHELLDDTTPFVAGRRRFPR